MIEPTAKNIFGWIDQITSLNLPFSFCENKVANKYSSLSGISRKTVMKYMKLISQKMVQKMKEEFKDKVLGMVFDGWSDGATGHYVAIFICYEGADGKCVYRLIAVSGYGR